MKAIFDFWEMCLLVLVLPVFIVCYGIAKCIKRNNKGKLFKDSWLGLWLNEIVFTKKLIEAHICWGTQSQIWWGIQVFQGSIRGASHFEFF